MCLFLGDLLVERAQRVASWLRSADSTASSRACMPSGGGSPQSILPCGLAASASRPQGRAVLGARALRGARRRSPAAAGDFAQAGCQRLARLAFVGGGFGGVELEQQVAP